MPKRRLFIESSHRNVAIALSLFAFASGGSAQTGDGTPPARQFDVVSLKRFNQLESGLYTPRSVEFKGNKLSGDVPLYSLIAFACSSLVSPYYVEFPRSWDNRSPDHYQIEAIAPTGTTTDEARAMLRDALAKRLGFQYHLVDRETPVYNLVRGSGALKLTPSTETPAGSYHRTPWDWRVEASTIADFARFLTGVAGRTVNDKTGIQGHYKFDLDWSDEVEASMKSGVGIDPVIAIDGVKQFGLKLEPGTEMRKILVVDRVNKEPTPN